MTLFAGTKKKASIPGALTFFKADAGMVYALFETHPDRGAMARVVANARINMSHFLALERIRPLQPDEAIRFVHLYQDFISSSSQAA